MKSIKEKSNEYAREFVEPFVLYYTKDEVRQFEAQHEDSFEAGANYVLGEIENVIKSDRILGHPFPSLEMRYNQIMSVIEQLKK